jgi:hypothetical protein
MCAPILVGFRQFSSDDCDGVTPNHTTIIQAKSKSLFICPSRNLAAAAANTGWCDSTELGFWATAACTLRAGKDVSGPTR